MKLKYKHQRFQADAAKSVVDIFRGQPYKDGVEHIIDPGKTKGPAQLAGLGVELGFGNHPLLISQPQMVKNIRETQMQWDLKPIEHLQGPKDHPMFTIEMETGTGKTYTYIKTMYELNRHYGWSKFVIIVPSIAIREGVLKSFETMQEHFASEYGKRMQYFVYNSKQLSKIDGFAQDNGLHVMIINTQAFNSSLKEGANNEAARIIFSRRDEFGSRRPIDIIAKTNPIVIIDEPQSVLGADKNNATRLGIQLFNPLFHLLYSATHRQDDKHNMVYRLDAMDAYNKKLVKKIEVVGITQIGSTATNSFVHLDEIVVGQGNPRARLSFDVKTAAGLRQTTRLVGEGFDLYEQSGRLEEYRDKYIVERIDGKNGFIRFLNGIQLSEHDLIGKVNDDFMRRQQIRETIRVHLERERQLFSKGIKVLSLFFIDEVANYRSPDGSTNGKFAEMFEQEYQEELKRVLPTFSDEAYLRYLSRWDAKRVHQGYFAQDKKGNSVDTKLKKGEDSSNDENALRAYDLIMKDKERLLSFEEPVRFIFSHSALKEGWDNPNVFQICTLKDTSNEIKKRQEVGRGMRLCVNKNGERQDQDVLGDGVFDTNVLTVIASESYEDFAKALQKDIAESIGDRPTEVTATLFEPKFGHSNALAIMDALVKREYVALGKPTMKYYDDKKDGKIDLGIDLNPIKEDVIRLIATIYNPQSINISNGRETKDAHFKQDAFYKKEFQELWKRINVKTYYKVDFDTDELVEKCIDAINKKLTVTEIRLVVTKGALEEIRDKESLMEGEAMTDGKSNTLNVGEGIATNITYDLIGQLVENTGLTRRTIVRILTGMASARFYMFRVNPEEFIIKVSNIINDEKAMAVIQKIAYEKTNQTYDADVFTKSTLRGKLGINAIESIKSLYDLVVVDSAGIEKNFAEELEHQEDVVVYTKLPRDFYINTPMGKYNPDWAVCFREGTVKHIYFIAETKGNDWQNSQLRGAEQAKIECAARHFRAISNSQVTYDVVRDYQSLYNKVMH